MRFFVVPPQNDKWPSVILNEVKNLKTVNRLKCDFIDVNKNNLCSSVSSVVHSQPQP